MGRGQTRRVQAGGGQAGAGQTCGRHAPDYRQRVSFRLVDFAFSEEQEMLRRSAREFLAKECSSKVVRKLMESPDSFDENLWKKLASLGWTALAIPQRPVRVG